MRFRGYEGYEELISQPLQNQLAELKRRAELVPQTGMWLRDNDLDLELYLRHNFRPIGPPRQSPFTRTSPQGVVHPRSIVECLDIADIRSPSSADPIDMETFASVMAKLYLASPWKPLCLDSIGDKDVSEWARRRGWQVYPTGDGHPRCLFLELPGGERIIESTWEPHTEALAGQLALSSTAFTGAPTTPM